MPDDELRSWLEHARPAQEPDDGDRGWWDEDGGELSGGRRWRLWILAVLPWLVVAGLALAGQARPAEPAPPGSFRPGSPGPEPASQEPAAEEAVVEEAIVEEAAAADGLEPAVAAVAALAVQSTVSGTDETTGRQRYVDLAVAEAMERTGDVAVVRVAAVVLEGEQGAWDRPRVAAYAVPIGLTGDRPAPVAPPWPLPDPPPTSPAVRAFATADDPQLAGTVREALSAAGYGGVEVTEVARDPALAGVVQAKVQATGPGETSPRVHTVWLREDPEPALLGMSEAT